MSKLTVAIGNLSFPLDADTCVMSEVLQKEFNDRQEKGDFSEHHEVPLPKRLLPMIIAYLSSLKLKAVVNQPDKPTEEPNTLESTPAPFQKMVSDLEPTSPEFEDLVKFQHAYKCQGLDDLLALFIYIKTKGMSGQSLSDALGMTYDGDLIDADRRLLVSHTIKSV